MSDAMMTKVDVVVSAATAAFVISPLVWVDLAAKVVPAGLISIYWLLRIVQHLTKKDNNWKQ